MKTMPFLHRAIQTGLALLLLSITSHAATLVSWTFDGLTGGSGGTSVSTTALASNSLDTNLSGTSVNLTKGSGLGTPSSGTANTWQFNGANSANLGGAITGGDFMSFSLAADVGYTFSLNSVTLLGSRGGANNVSVALFSSVGGFTSGSEIGTGTISSTTTSSPTSVVFSGLTLTGLSASTEFRVYFYGAELSGTGVRLGDSDGSTPSGFVVDGTTAIPEPTTWALLAGGLTTLVVFRRRRQA